MKATILVCKFKNLIQKRYKASIGLWNEDISNEIKLNIEKYWSDSVHRNKIKSKTESTYYVLPMFPYPSGNLHMGHVRVYTISDTIARFQEMNGKNVIHPMGWDAFGLPAENAAIERNIPPQYWTDSNICAMKRQLHQLGFKFDWNRELSTCSPDYYKWTQYIFLKLYENGLAYQSKSTVNWDPIDKTVLADEQVDEFGRSWRSEAKVEKKVLTQWFIKTTKFAKQLYDGLDSKYLENWKDIINLQKHWIGECDGIIVNFKLLSSTNSDPINFDVWSSQPYKFLYGDFIVFHENNIIIKDLANTKNLKAFNPVSNKEMPVYVCNEAKYAEGRDIHIVCHKDKEDEDLINTLNISRNENSHTLINFETENKKAIDIAISKNVGGYFVSSKLKDWLISRQRYWGTPIPIIHCDKCGAVPVPYEDLPVKLPDVNFTELQTLAKFENWVKCKCPVCDTNARRETDTMDTFVDSSWYYYRFLDPKNDKAPFDKEKLDGKTPVYIYIGGKEHAVLHLYYARFMSYFLHSIGWTIIPEPFKKLLVQGMVMGQSYKLKSSGKYIPPENVEKINGAYKEKVTGEIVTVQWEKMSKSKYNGENPARLLSTYGCDTTRLLILADVPPATSRNWSDATFPGVLNWQHRIWITVREFIDCRRNAHNYKISSEEFDEYESKIWDNRNHSIATATYYIKYTQQLSVSISRLQSLTSVLRNKIPQAVIAQSEEYELALACLIVMLSPMAPHFCSELWAGFISAPRRESHKSNWIKWDKEVMEQTWPIVDDDYGLSFVCKVDGEKKCGLRVKCSDLEKMSAEDALTLVTKETSIMKMLRRGISHTKFEFYPGCRGILYIYTNKKQTKNIEKAVNC